jgi:hypothetical protein
VVRFLIEKSSSLNMQKVENSSLSNMQKVEKSSLSNMQKVENCDRMALTAGGPPYAETQDSFTAR